VAYCNLADANNLKGRFQKRLVPRELDKKEPRLGLRWLRPGTSDLLVRGEVRRRAGRKKIAPFLSLVGELLPRDAWPELPENISGVYVLFDSSETARYVGISDDIRGRLYAYFNGKRKADEEKRAVTVSFSVFMIANRKNARELESLLIHVLGPALFLNKQKQRRFGAKPDVNVFEAGTLVLQRRSKTATLTGIT
jgi:predicted GIY-YIG superfamily endonuclease